MIRLQLCSDDSVLIRNWLPKMIVMDSECCNHFIDKAAIQLDIIMGKQISKHKHVINVKRLAVIAYSCFMRQLLSSRRLWSCIFHPCHGPALSGPAFSVTANVSPYFLGVNASSVTLCTISNFCRSMGWDPGVGVLTLLKIRRRYVLIP